MASDVVFVEKAIYLILSKLNLMEFLTYTYEYLKKHPDQVKKIYLFAKAIVELIENEFKHQLG